MSEYSLENLQGKIDYSNQISDKASLQSLVSYIYELLEDILQIRKRMMSTIDRINEDVEDLLPMLGEYLFLEVIRLINYLEIYVAHMTSLIHTFTKGCDTYDVLQKMQEHTRSDVYNVRNVIRSEYDNICVSATAMLDRIINEGSIQNPEPFKVLKKHIIEKQVLLVGLCDSLDR